jgi:hypothetical protein
MLCSMAGVVRIRRWDINGSTFADEGITPGEPVSSFLPKYAKAQGALLTSYLTLYQVKEGNGNVDAAEEIALTAAQKESDELPLLPDCLVKKLKGTAALHGNEYIVALYKPPSATG